MTELKSGFGGCGSVNPAFPLSRWFLHICIRCSGLPKETEKGEKRNETTKKEISKEVTAGHLLLLTTKRNFSVLVTTSNNRTLTSLSTF